MSASKSSASKTSENKRDYEVGRGKPPVHSRFTKGQSGNPRGPCPQNFAGIAGRHRRGMANRRNVESRSDKPVKREVRKPWRRSMEPSYMTRR